VSTPCMRTDDHPTFLSIRIFKYFSLPHNRRISNSATVPGAISLVLQTVNYCRRVKHLCPLSVWWVCRLRTSVLVKLVDRMVFFG